MQKGGKWIGVDISLDMLLSAKGRFTKRNYAGCFVNANVLDLPFKKKIVDTVICIGVINYFTLKEINLILQEVNRVLKPKGRFIFTNLKFDFLTYLRSRFPQFLPRPIRVPGPLYPHRKTNIITLFKNNNFSLKRTQEVKKYRFLPYFTMMEVEKI